MYFSCCSISIFANEDRIILISRDSNFRELPYTIPYLYACLENLIFVFSSSVREIRKNKTMRKITVYSKDLMYGAWAVQWHRQSDKSASTLQNHFLQCASVLSKIGLAQLCQHNIENNRYQLELGITGILE